MLQIACVSAVLISSLSFAARIIAVAAIAGQIAAVLSKLPAVYELPGNLHTANNEIADLEVRLCETAAVITELQSCLSIKQQEGLPAVLKRANDKLLKLDSAVQRLIQPCIGEDKFVTAQSVLDGEATPAGLAGRVA